MGSSCQWHEEKGTGSCSLGSVKKYAFLIADGICQLFDIKLTDKHVPQQIENVGMIVKNGVDFGKQSDRFRKIFSSSRNSFSYVNGTKNSSSRFEDDDDDDVQYEDSVDSESIISYNPPKRIIKLNILI